MNVLTLKLKWTLSKMHEEMDPFLLKEEKRLLVAFVKRCLMPHGSYHD